MKFTTSTLLILSLSVGFGKLSKNSASGLGEMATKERHWTSCFGTFYDVLTQVISVLDVTTDIWVCISFHLDGRKTFFVISLTILSLAMISYAAAFTTYFHGNQDCNNRFHLFFLALPFAPILPFAFHYPDQAEGFFSRIFCLCLISVKSSIDDSSSSEASKFKQFFEEKVEKHMGFILESLIEGICLYLAG